MTLYYHNNLFIYKNILKIVILVFLKLICPEYFLIQSGETIEIHHNQHFIFTIIFISALSGAVRYL